MDKINIKCFKKSIKHSNSLPKKNKGNRNKLINDCDIEITIKTIIYFKFMMRDENQESLNSTMSRNPLIMYAINVATLIIARHIIDVQMLIGTIKNIGASSGVMKNRAIDWAKLANIKMNNT